MFTRFRTAAVLLCSDSCRLALPSVFWLYLVIRGADPYRVECVWKPSFPAFRRYVGLWYSEHMTRRHYWNSLQPCGPRWFLALIWTQMQLIVDCMLQRLRRPSVEDLIWLWESTPAMIRMVIMVWGSKPQFSGSRCQCKLCIRILKLYLVTKVLWIPMKFSGEDPPGMFWNIGIYGISCWHDVLTY